jgi:hypothetical protein
MMPTQNERYAMYRYAARDVLVDFDGTLCEFSYPDFGEPRPGAREFMEWLVAQGLRPIIWTTRLNGNYVNDMLERDSLICRLHVWLYENKIPYSGIDYSMDGKRLALAYVDDRGVSAGPGVSWEYVMNRISDIKQREDARWEEYDASCSTQRQDG